MSDDNVIPLAGVDTRGRHLSGKVMCTACHHTYYAAVPIGVEWLECPACHLIKAHFINPALPVSGTPVWRCGCGNHLFLITNTGAFCVHCGVEQKF